MADTAVPTIMEIVHDLGGSGDPKTVVPALLLLRDALGSLASDIDQAVSDWLDDHPEATTTVEDGSITYAKLNSSLAGMVDIHFGIAEVDGQQTLVIVDDRS